MIDSDHPKRTCDVNTCLDSSDRNTNFLLREILPNPYQKGIPPNIQITRLLLGKRVYFIWVLNPQISTRTPLVTEGNTRSHVYLAGEIKFRSNLTDEISRIPIPVSPLHIGLYNCYMNVDVMGAVSQLKSRWGCGLFNHTRTRFFNRKKMVPNLINHISDLQTSIPPIGSDSLRQIHEFVNEISLVITRYILASFPHLEPPHTFGQF